MKKRFLTILLAAASCTVTVFLASCSPATEYFGEFSYYGKHLTEYAVGNKLSASEAKSIITKSSAAESNDVAPYSAVTDIVGNDGAPSPSESTINSILSVYSQCELTATYYDASGEKKNTSFILTGANLQDALTKNEVTPFNQIIAKYLVMDSTVLDYMEEMNAKFQASENSITVPFKDIYTYWKDKNGNLVVKTADYAEIPSSISGGIGCNFRQDIEIIYDADHKITKWQTSLGIQIVTPEGTVKQGYIFELDFDWEIRT